MAENQDSIGCLKTYEDSEDGRAVFKYEGKIMTDTPLLTEHQDVAGAINELVNTGSSGGSTILTEDSVFRVPTTPNLDWWESIEKGNYVNIKLLKGPFSSSCYKQHTCNGYDCDVVQEYWEYWDEEGKVKYGATFPRIVYLTIQSRGTPNEYCSGIYFQKWAVGNYGGTYGPNALLPGTSISAIDHYQFVNGFG